MNKLKVFWVLHKDFCVKTFLMLGVLILIVFTISILNIIEQTEKDYCESIGKVRVQSYLSEAYCAEGTKIK